MLAGAHQRKQNSHNFWRVGTLTILATLIFSLGFAVAGRENAHATSPAEPNTWTLLAAGERTAVFSTASDYLVSTGSNLNNGTYWYFGGYAKGFAPSDTLDIKVNQYSGYRDAKDLATCTSANKGDQRLSVEVNPGALGGARLWATIRVGCLDTYNTSSTVVAFYQANSLPSYYPSGPQLNVSNTLSGNGWTLCSIYDFKSDQPLVSNITNACSQRYILMAANSSYQSAPTISAFSSTTTSPRNDSNASYSVVFSQSVTGLATDDFENAGTATGCSYTVTGSGTTYTLSISSCSDGTIQPRLKANSVSGSAFAGPASAATATSTITKDSVAPSIPATPDLASDSDSGSSNNDNITKNKRPTITVSGSFTGTATVTAAKAGSASVSCTILSGACTFTSDLADGVWSVTATESDSAGNSATSSALLITIDTIAPTKPSISSQYATNNMTIPVQSSEIGIAYLASNTSLRDDYLTSANDEFWNSTPITVANTPTDLSTSGFRNSYWYSYYVTDIAGNISARSDNYVMIAAADPPYFGSPNRPTSSSPADAVGSTLTNVMSANGVPTPTITYQYVRCPSVSGDWVPKCVNIPGATSSTYTLTADDVGQHIGVRITATNSQGTASQLGVATAQVTAAVPGTPTSVSATITGSTTASISFTAPTSNGGAAITDYDLEYSSNSGSTWTSFNNGTSTTNPILVTGLTAKTSYIFRVKAKNSAGEGSFSVASSVQTTLKAPTVVTNEGPDNLVLSGSFKVGDTLTNKMTFDGFPEPTLSFQYFRCPTNVGVLASDYISSGCVDIPGATSSTYILTGDDVGKYMGVKVTATNSSGSLVLTPKRNTLVTANSPGAPTSVSATITGSTTASVAFTAPASNGGSAITDYDLQYSSNNGSSWSDFNNGTSTVNPILVTGLTANTSYIFRVKAKNSAGTGIDSSPSSSAVTLVAPTLTVLKDESNIANDTPISLPPGTLTDPCASNSYYTITFSSGSCGREPSNYSQGNVDVVNMFVNTNRSVFLNFLQPITSVTFDACCVDSSVYVLVQYEDSNPSSFYVGNSGFVSYLLPVNTSLSPPGQSIRYQISFADGRLIKKIGLGFNSNGSSSSGDITIYDNFGFSVAPLATSVSVSSKSLTAGTAATSFTPITASGGGSSKTYSILPALPSGLSLNTSTGAITGTPTGASPSTSYTVSVFDGSSNSSATFTLGVNAALSSSAGTVPSGVYKDVAVTAFTPISFSGGTSPISYAVLPSLPAGLTLNTSTGVISGTATGTSPNTTYTVTATDANGDSEASTFAFAVTNQPTAPGAPTIGAATSTGQTTATVAFTAPANTGGAAITTYTVTASPGSITATGSSSPITVTGLTAGTAYTFSITATNAGGLTSTSSSPSSSITTESAPVQNNNNGGGGGGGGSPAPEPAPEPVCNAACVAAQNAAAKAAADKAAAEKAAAEKLIADKAAAEKAAAEKLVADKATAVAVAEKTKVDVSAAATAATAAVEKATAAAAAAKVDVDTVAAAVSTIVNSTNSSAAITKKITNEAAASISSAPAAATKAASTASANTKANSAASQVRAAATAAQKAATSSQAQTSAAPEISLGSSNTGSAAAQAAARANAAARAGKAAANEVAATAEAKAVESKATATALQNEANAAVAEAIAEQKVATALAVEAKAAADKASTLSAEKIAATTAAKTAAEILVELLKEKVTVAEKIAAAVTVEVLAEAQKSLDTVNAKIAEAERTVAETASKADAAISAQVEAIKVAEAAKASAEAQLAKVDQLNAAVPTKAAAAVRAASVAAVDAKIATAAKAAAAKVPSKAVISAKPGASTGKNSTRATISGLKPGQKVKVTVNVKPKP